MIQLPPMLPNFETISTVNFRMTDRQHGDARDRQAVVGAMISLDNATASNTGTKMSEIFLHSDLAAIRARVINRIADELEHETSVLSSPSQMLAQPGLAALRRFSNADVITLAGSRLDSSPVFWMVVLRDISQQSPVP